MACGWRPWSLVCQARAKQRAIDLFEETLELLLMRCAHHENAAAFRGRESDIVQVILVEGEQGAAKLSRHAEVLEIGRAAQIVLFHHEEHIPAELLAHEPDEPRRQIRIAIHAWRIRQPFDDAAET